MAIVVAISRFGTWLTDLESQEDNQSWDSVPSQDSVPLRVRGRGFSLATREEDSSQRKRKENGDGGNTLKMSRDVLYSSFGRAIIIYV